MIERLLKVLTQLKKKNMNLGSEIEELIEYLKEEENLSDEKKKKN